MIQTEVQDFWIHSFKYRLYLPSQGSINLTLIDGYSQKIGDLRRAREEYDPFQKWEDYDPNDFSLVGDENIGANPFALKRECIQRIVGWANSNKPGFFTISASTDRKSYLYNRVCKHLSEKLDGYAQQTIGTSHYFFRESSRYVG